MELRERERRSDEIGVCALRRAQLVCCACVVVTREGDVREQKMHVRNASSARF